MGVKRMRRRLAGVMRAIPLSLSTKGGAAVSTVLETVVVRLEGRGFSGLEEAATTSFSEGTLSNITVGEWGTVGPLQGGSSSSSLGTGEFGMVERWGALEALFEESEESTIQKQMTKRVVDKEERELCCNLGSLYIRRSVDVTLGIRITRDITHVCCAPLPPDYLSAEGSEGSRQAQERKKESQRGWMRGRSASVLLMDESIRKSIRQASKPKRNPRGPMIRAGLFCKLGFSNNYSTFFWLRLLETSWPRFVSARIGGSVLTRPLPILGLLPISHDATTAFMSTKR